MKRVSLSTYGGLAISVLTAVAVVMVVAPVLSNLFRSNPASFPSAGLPLSPEFGSYWQWLAVVAVLVQLMSLKLLTTSPLLGKGLALFATMVLFPLGLIFLMCYWVDCHRWRLRQLQEVKFELKPEHPQFGFCDEDPLAFGLAGVGILMLIVGMPLGALAILAGLVIFARNLAGKKKTALMVTSEALYLTPNPWLGCYRIPFSQIAAVSMVKNQLKLQLDCGEGKPLMLSVNLNAFDRDLRRQARDVLLEKLAHAGLLHEPVVA
ncbi:hypothetical protein [Photobacterium galatheae]|uniref:Uncharacterized protein n=1 Tax=Photobacterium galatheae TaxID=1654360 RepID=A0A066RW73_9GAMM|nr:hypothetical protein [Photobacterium galatheae]KDM91957.1 hypothetical protein EA58_09530 [Photobacterium galatheae]MCM0147629.1 hypothetical protein [Photobacterium galatheae]